MGSSGEKPGHRAQGVSIKFVHGNRDVGAKKTAVREDAQGAEGTEEEQEEHRRTSTTTTTTTTSAPRFFALVTEEELQQQEGT